MGTISSADFEVLSFWLFLAAQDSMLASSAGIEKVLEAGTIMVTSSAYFISELPGVHTFKSEVEIINMGGPKAEPWTTPVLI